MPDLVQIISESCHTLQTGGKQFLTYGVLMTERTSTTVTMAGHVDRGKLWRTVGTEGVYRRLTLASLDAPTQYVTHPAEGRQ